MTDAWKLAGRELSKVMAEALDPDRAVDQETRDKLVELSTDLLFCHSKGQEDLARIVESRIELLFAALVERERGRLRTIFTHVVVIGGRILRAALGVPA